MRNLLAFFAAAALTVVGVGWYLGWFRTVKIELNTTKIREDLNKGGQKVHQLLENRRKERAEGKTDGGQETSEKPAPRGKGYGPGEPEPVMTEDQFKKLSPEQKRQLRQ